MPKKHHVPSMECSAGEYFWLCNELAKTRQALRGLLLSGGEGETAQAYAILAEFYQKAAQAFQVRPGTKVVQPVTISQKFLEDLKTLDSEGLIDLKLVRKGGARQP